MNGIRVVIKRDPRDMISLGLANTEREGSHLQKRKRVHNRNGMGGYLDLGLFSPQYCEM